MITGIYRPFLFRQNARGMALVITLMVTAIVTAVVVEFAYGVYVNTVALRNWSASQQLSLSARSAVRLASMLVAEYNARFSYTYPGVYETSRDDLTGEIEGTVSVKIEDENAKFNINSIVHVNGELNRQAYDGFLRLLLALDINHEAADRITDWIDSDSVSRLADSEKASSNRRLDSIEELLLIPGIGRETYERLLPYVTISGNGMININTADIPVLMSLSDTIGTEKAARIKAYREAAPFEKIQDISRVAGFETISTSLMGHITVKGNAFRVTGTAVSSGIRRSIETILEISGGERIVRYWRET